MPISTDRKLLWPVFSQPCQLQCVSFSPLVPLFCLQTTSPHLKTINILPASIMPSSHFFLCTCSHFLGLYMNSQPQLHTETPVGFDINCISFFFLPCDPLFLQPSTPCLWQPPIYEFCIFLLGFNSTYKKRSHALVFL